jgi:hypothetical protein
MARVTSTEVSGPLALIDTHVTGRVCLATIPFR